MPVYYCVTMPMLEFTNGFSTLILKISVLSGQLDVLKILSRFPPSNDYSASSSK